MSGKKNGSDASVPAVIEEAPSALVVPDSGNFLAANFSRERLDRFLDELGEGISDAPEDNLVPSIRILQNNSPEVQPGPAQLVGAKASDFLLKNSPIPFVPGSEGFLFVPCFDEHVWCEYRPRREGGGYQGESPEEPKDVEKVYDEREKKTTFVRPNGNEVQETRRRFGLVVTTIGLLKFAVTYKGTGHSEFRAMNTRMSQLLHPTAGRPYPSYAHVWRFTSRFRQKNNFTWYGYEHVCERASTEVEEEAGRAFRTAWKASKVKAVVEDLADEEGRAQIEGTPRGGPPRPAGGVGMEDRPFSPLDAERPF